MPKPIPLKKLHYLGLIGKNEVPRKVEPIDPRKLFAESARRGFYLSKKRAIASVGRRGITISNFSHLGGADFMISALRVHASGGEKILLLKEYTGSPAVEKGVIARARSANRIRRLFAKEKVSIEIPLMVPHGGTLLAEYVEGRHLNGRELSQVQKTLEDVKKRNPDFVFHPFGNDDFIVSRDGRIYWIDVEAFIRQ